MQLSGAWPRAGDGGVVASLSEGGRWCWGPRWSLDLGLPCPSFFPCCLNLPLWVWRGGLVGVEGAAGAVASSGIVTCVCCTSAGTGLGLPLHLPSPLPRLEAEGKKVSHPDPHHSQDWSPGSSASKALCQAGALPKGLSCLSPGRLVAPGDQGSVLPAAPPHTPATWLGTPMGLGGLSCSMVLGEQVGKLRLYE